MYNDKGYVEKNGTAVLTIAGIGNLLEQFGRYSTYQTAAKQAWACLKSGLTNKAIVSHRGMTFVFTMDPTTRAILRDGFPC